MNDDNLSDSNNSIYKESGENSLFEPAEDKGNSNNFSEKEPQQTYSALGSDFGQEAHFSPSPPKSEYSVPPTPKYKQEKTKIPFSLIATVLILSAVVSAVSGAASSFIIFKFIPPSSTVAETTTNPQPTNITEYQTDDAEPETQSNIISTTEEDNTFMPSLVEESPEETTVAKISALSKGDVYANAVNSIYAIKSEYNKVYSSFFGQTKVPITSKGTGFAINESGYILTNYHVIENGAKITLTNYNGDVYTAKLIGSEANNDIAVLKINVKTVPVKLGLSSSLKVGDDIMVIGNALGELSYTFTDGIVSHLNRSVLLESGKTINMFQTNAAINSGNSGGPVYNMDGEVIGVASAKYASESVEGLGFCIPIDDIKDLVSQIILYGYVKNKPSMGVSIQTVTASMSVRYHIPIGCYIVSVAEASAAYKTGLRPGDVIIEINGTQTSKYEDVETILSKFSAGNTISVTYSRNGNSSAVDMTLDEYKPAKPRTPYTNVHDF